MEHDLESLERDLNAVTGRLAPTRDWSALGPRIRHAVRRPTRDLAWTICLIVFCGVSGIWVTQAWMVAIGLLLAVLPKRIRAFRDRGEKLSTASEGELFELYDRELGLRMAHHFSQALLDVLLVVMFLIVAVFAKQTSPPLIVAGLLVVDAVVRIFWGLPRAGRERDALGLTEGEDS